MADARRHTWEERHRHRDGSPHPPSPFVANALELLSGHHAVAAPRHRRALDVACGAGRHTLLLADRGYAAIGVDWAHAAVAALRNRARAAGLAIDGIVADVTHWPFRLQRFDVVVIVDFLERALVPALRSAVAPGGVLIMETFLRGHERHGHLRNPAYLLAPGELAAMCPDWTVLAAYEGEVEDPTPACRAGIVAVRPSNVDSPEPFGSYRPR